MTRTDSLALLLLLPLGAHAYSGGLDGGGVAGIVVGVVVFCALVLGVAWYIYYVYRPKQLARRKLEKWDDLPISACHKVEIADLPEMDCELQASAWMKVPGPERAPSSSSIKLPCTGYGQASPKKGNFIMRWIEEGLAQDAGNPETACIPCFDRLSLRRVSHRLSRHQRCVSDSHLVSQRTTSDRMERASLLASGADSARFPHDPWQGIDSEENDEDARQSRSRSRWHTLSTRSESLPTPQQMRDFFKQDNQEGFHAHGGKVHPGMMAQEQDNSREWHDAKSRGGDMSGHSAQNAPFPNCVLNPLGAQ